VAEMKRFRRRSIITIIILLIIIVAGAFVYESLLNPPRDDGQNPDAQATAMAMPHEGGDSDFMTNFRTIDIFGNEIGDEIFADYRLTMVYVWGTF